MKHFYGCMYDQVKKCLFFILRSVTEGSTTRLHSHISWFLKHDVLAINSVRWYLSFTIIDHHYTVNKRSNAPPSPVSATPNPQLLLLCNQLGGRCCHSSSHQASHPRRPQHNRSLHETIILVIPSTNSARLLQCWNFTRGAQLQDLVHPWNESVSGELQFRQSKVESASWHISEVTQWLEWESWEEGVR